MYFSLSGYLSPKSLSSAQSRTSGILKKYDNDLLYFSMESTNNGLEIFIDAVNQNLHDLLPLDLELSNEGLKNGFKKGQFLEIEPMLLIFYHD